MCLIRLYSSVNRIRDQVSSFPRVVQFNFNYPNFRMSQPLFIGKLMEYYTPNQTTVSKNTAYLYAGGIVGMSFLNVLMGHSYMLGLQHLGMKIRVASCSLIYRKSLRLSKGALVDTTVGQMVNLLSNDVNRFDMCVTHMHNLWVTPILTIIVMYILYTTLGFSALIGIAILLSFIPLQSTVTGFYLKSDNYKQMFFSSVLG